MSGDDVPGKGGVMKRCSVPKCGQPYKALGLCSMHDQRMRRGIKLTLPILKVSTDVLCYGDKGCDNQVIARRLCRLHYNRAYFAGELSGTKIHGGEPTKYPL